MIDDRPLIPPKAPRCPLCGTTDVSAFTASSLHTPGHYCAPCKVQFMRAHRAKQTREQMRTRLAAQGAACACCTAPLDARNRRTVHPYRQRAGAPVAAVLCLPCGHAATYVRRYGVPLDRLADFLRVTHV